MRSIGLECTIATPMLLASQSVWELQRYSLIQQHLCPTRWQKSSWPSFEVDLDGKLACRRRSSSLTADAPRLGACRREPVVEPRMSWMPFVTIITTFKGKPPAMTPKVWRGSRRNVNVPVTGNDAS